MQDQRYEDKYWKYHEAAKIAENIRIKGRDLNIKKKLRTERGFMSHENVNQLKYKTKPYMRAYPQMKMLNKKQYKQSAVSKQCAPEVTLSIRRPRSKPLAIYSAWH